MLGDIDNSTVLIIIMIMIIWRTWHPKVPTVGADIAPAAIPGTARPQPESPDHTRRVFHMNVHVALQSPIDQVRVDTAVGLGGFVSFC